MGFGAWRSLVAHLPWEQGVGRSNRLAPIFAPVAQGKEQRPSKPRVRGSNPFWRAPNLLKAFFPQEVKGRYFGACVSIEVVSVAQLAEHRVVASVVEGSSPFTHPKFFSRAC